MNSSTESITQSINSSLSVTFTRSSTTTTTTTTTATSQLPTSTIPSTSPTEQSTPTIIPGGGDDVNVAGIASGSAIGGFILGIIATLLFILLYRKVIKPRLDNGYCRQTSDKKQPEANSFSEIGSLGKNGTLAGTDGPYLVAEMESGNQVEANTAVYNNKGHDIRNEIPPTNEDYIEMQGSTKVGNQQLYVNTPNMNKKKFNKKHKPLQPGKQSGSLLSHKYESINIKDLQTKDNEIETDKGAIQDPEYLEVLSDTTGFQSEIYESVDEPGSSVTEGKAMNTSPTPQIKYKPALSTENDKLNKSSPKPQIKSKPTLSTENEKFTKSSPKPPIKFKPKPAQRPKSKETTENIGNSNNENLPTSNVNKSSDIADNPPPTLTNEDDSVLLYQNEGNDIIYENV